MEKIKLADEFLKKRSVYIQERGTLSQQVSKGRLRLAELENLILACENLLREEGVTSFEPITKAKDKPSTADDESLGIVSEDGRNSSRILLSVIKRHPEGLTPKEVIAKVVEIGHKMTTKTIYNTLFVLKRDHKVKKIQGKYYMPDES